MQSSVRSGVSNGSRKRITAAKKKEWKPPKHQSYECMGLTSTEKNPIVRPCGFQRNGLPRKVKDTCLISRMRQLAIKKDTRVKIAVCVTMYNETEDEL